MFHFVIEMVGCVLRKLQNVKMNEIQVLIEIDTFYHSPFTSRSATLYHRPVQWCISDVVVILFFFFLNFIFILVFHFILMKLHSVCFTKMCTIQTMQHQTTYKKKDHSMCRPHGKLKQWCKLTYLPT